MPSMTEQIDRLTLTMNAIKASASSITLRDHSGPFTQAVLATPLGDLVRDIDPTELGLFTLVSPPQQPRVNTQTGPAPEIARVEVVSATPLRKHRGDVIVQHKEPEPEVFVEAALKYIDRYSGVRPMSRARSQVVAMQEHLGQLREEIHSFTTSLKDMEASGLASNSQSPKSLMVKEEKKIQELQTRIGHLKKRKEALQDNHAAFIAPVADHRATPPELQNTVASDPQEDSFWTTPRARRTPQFKNDLLVDEDVDLENVTSSFSSPVVPFKSSKPLSIPTDSPFQHKEGPTDTMSEDFSALEDTFDCTTGTHDINPEQTGQVDHQTIEAKHHPAQPLLQSVPPPTSEPSTPVVNTELFTSSSTAENLGHTHSAKKVRITNEVERIVSKIWATVGDLIMPGNAFSTSGSGSRPLRAKETIAYLHSLAAQDPLPASPTASSVSSTTVAAAQSPTSQQVLTAHLLISLMEATQYALPLARVKEILSARGDKGVSPIGSGASVRILYGCVAKRLVRIDRGGGEQIVRFDV